MFDISGVPVRSIINYSILSSLHNFKELGKKNIISCDLIDQWLTMGKFKFSTVDRQFTEYNEGKAFYYGNLLG